MLHADGWSRGALLSAGFDHIWEHSLAESKRNMLVVVPVCRTSLCQSASSMRTHQVSGGPPFSSSSDTSSPGSAET